MLGRGAASPKTALAFLLLADSPAICVQTKHIVCFFLWMMPFLCKWVHFLTRCSKGRDDSSAGSFFVSFRSQQSYCFRQNWDVAEMAQAGPSSPFHLWFSQLTLAVSLFRLNPIFFPTAPVSQSITLLLSKFEAVAVSCHFSQIAMTLIHFIRLQVSSRSAPWGPLTVLVRSLAPQQFLPDLPRSLFTPSPPPMSRLNHIISFYNPGRSSQWDLITKDPLYCSV